MQDQFRAIYNRKIWGTDGDGSGGGSEPCMTVTTRGILSGFIENKSIESMLDAPCGACKWTRILWDDIRTRNPNFVYRGIDIVPEVIEHNIQRYQDDKTTFSVCNIVDDEIPSGYDLVMCRDTLQHLSYYDIYKALQNFKRIQFKWILLGGYVPGMNISERTPASFQFNPTTKPFCLTPDLILCENTPISPQKYLFVYKYETFQSLPIDSILSRI